MKEKSKVAIIVAIVGVVSSAVSGVVSGIASSSITKIQQYEYWNSQLTSTNEFWISQISNIQNNNNNNNNNSNNNSNGNNINITNNYPITEKDIEENSNNIDFTVDTTVRLADNEDKIWYKNIEASIGDILEFDIEYKNTGDVDQKNVVIKDILPDGLRLLSENVTLYNVNHKSGLVLDNGDSLIENGFNVGSYTYGSNAFLRFRAEVVDEGALSYGSNTLTNWGQAEVGQKTIKNSVNIYVNKEAVE